LCLPNQAAEIEFPINNNENWRKKYNRIHPHSHLGMPSHNILARLWQQTKQIALGSAQATPLLRQGIVPETSLQPI
jgi:hypothetical protein